MKKLTMPFFCFLLIVLLATGCEKTKNPSSKKPETERGAEKTFLLGLIPEQNIFKQMERYEPLAGYLSKKVGMKIQLTVLPRYGNIINNFVSTGLDGAFFGSFTYTLAHEKLGVEVLARPLSPDGTSTYHGLIFVRKDSGIKSIHQMAGKRFAFVDKATTAGYLLPLAYFQEHGKDYRTFLKESYFTGTHEDAIFDVLNKKADVGAAKNTVYERVAASNDRIKKELVILERSPDVPENALAVRKDLDNPMKKKLKEALLTMHEDPEGMAILKVFGAQRFIETNETDYQPVYRYAEKIKLNLATYDYMNE
jgi:phosphonate transport system substrate-binding protein